MQATIIDAAMRVINNPTASPYALTRAGNTLSGIQKRQQRAENERKAKDRAKRQARDKASADQAKQEMLASIKQEMLASILPDNGRGPAAAPPRRPVDRAMLPRPGESPAITRARLEKLVEQGA